MGKVRRLRQKYHLACQKSEVTSKLTPIVPVVQSVPGQPDVPVKLSDESNLFAGVTISLSDLKQTLLPPSQELLGSVSEASVVGTQTNSSLKHVPKKEKRLVRREALLRKIDTVRKLKQESKQRLKREKTAVTGDLRPLMDALPSLSTSRETKSQLGTKNSKDKQNKHRHSTLSQKKRKKALHGRS